MSVPTAWTSPLERHRGCVPMETFVKAIEGTLDVDVLPQDQLEQLMESGHLEYATDFENHMHPDVHWIQPTEFGDAFAEMCREV